MHNILKVQGDQLSFVEVRQLLVLARAKLSVFQIRDEPSDRGQYQGFQWFIRDLTKLESNH